MRWFTQFRRCRRAGVQVTFSRLLGIWLRRVRAAEVLEAVAIATEAGVEFPVEHAEIAFLAGGHPLDQARAAAIIAGRGKPVELLAVSACDLAGYDVVKLAQDGWDLTRVVGAADGPGDEYRRQRPLG